jgi:hypothetical protein
MISIPGSDDLKPLQLVPGKIHCTKVFMIQVAIVSRRLREGRTYEDFRKVWYHTVGFGSRNKMYTAINAFDPREIIVIGLTETDSQQLASQCDIDIVERLAHPLDEIVEPEIERKFGVLVSEDDFSAVGEIPYREPVVSGKELNYEQLEQELKMVKQVLGQASKRK